MDEEARLLQRYGRQSTFRVPEGYFESLTQRVLSQTTQRTSPTVSLWARLRKPLAVAAGVCVLTAVALHLLPREDTSRLTAQASQPKAGAASPHSVAAALQPQMAAVLPLPGQAAAPQSAEPARHPAEAAPHTPAKAAARPLAPTAQPLPPTQGSHEDEADETPIEMLEATADYMMLDADKLYALLDDE